MGGAGGGREGLNWDEHRPGGEGCDREGHGLLYNYALCSTTNALVARQKGWGPPQVPSSSDGKEGPEGEDDHSEGYEDCSGSQTILPVHDRRFWLIRALPIVAQGVNPRHEAVEEASEDWWNPPKG